MKLTTFLDSENLKFENLPHAVGMMRAEIDEIKKIILDKTFEGWTPELGVKVQKFSPKKAILFLADFGYEISLSTLYKMTSERKIPHSKMDNNRLIFDKAELLDWVEEQYCKPGERLPVTAKALAKSANLKINPKSKKK